MNIAVGSLASATALAPSSALAPAMALDHDPILAAVERHRVAWAANLQALEAKLQLECELPDSARKTSWGADDEWLVETDDARWIAAGREEDRTYHEAKDAAYDLLNGEITSIAGALALLRYTVEFQLKGDSWPEEVAATEGDDPALDGRPWHVWVQSRVADFLQSRA